MSGSSRSSAFVGAAAALALSAAVAALPACAPTDEERTGALIYGDDNRLDVFASPSAEARARAARSVVALIPKTSIAATSDGFSVRAPTLAERAGLCPGERFGDEPAAAFCSGVLVDRDLVLTAGHCLRAFALQDFSVVFGYYYQATGQLAPLEVIDPTTIVAEALDPSGQVPRRDYGWLRLARAASPERSPSPIYVEPRTPRVGDPVLSIGAGDGVPLKIDSGGTIRDPRGDSGDYFLADVDTSGGSSGGGAFDPQLALEGILVRGAPDTVPTDGGCAVTARLPGGQDGGEQLTYASVAVAGLCDASSPSSICRPDCGSPCQALPAEPGGGCAVAPTMEERGRTFSAPLLLLAVSLARRCRCTQSSRKSA
jgi:hypothetical protein